MTEETKSKVKQRVVDGSKLIAAIGALTTAILGYDSMLDKLEVVVQINAMKLNALTTEVAYLRGRVDGLGKTSEAASPAAAEYSTAATSDSLRKLTKEDMDDVFDDGSVEAKTMGMTFKEMPLNMDGLQQFQQELFPPSGD